MDKQVAVLIVVLTLSLVVVADVLLVEHRELGNRFKGDYEMDIVNFVKRQARQAYSEMPKAKVIPNKKKQKLDKLRRKEYFND